MENNENLKRDGYTIQMTDRFGAKVYPKLDTTVIADALDGQENALSADCLKDGNNNIVVPKPEATSKGMILTVDNDIKPTWGFAAGAIRGQLKVDKACGNLTPGTIFGEGTPVEYILRKMLCDSPAPGVDFVRYGFLALDASSPYSLAKQFRDIATEAGVGGEKLYTNSIQLVGKTISASPICQCAAFFIMVPVAIDPSQIESGLYKDACSGFITDFDNADITSIDSTSWLGNIAQEIEAYGVKYRVYALLNDEFNYIGEVKDVISVSFK